MTHVSPQILKEQNSESEAKIVSMRRDITSLQDKVERLHKASSEDERTRMKMEEMKRNFERTKASQLEEKTKLSTDLDKVQTKMKLSHSSFSFLFCSSDTNMPQTLLTHSERRPQNIYS